MTPGDMPAFDPLLQMALKGLNDVKDAMTKHVVLISDGDPAPPTSGVMSQLIQSKITVTAILITSHSNDPSVFSVMRRPGSADQGAILLRHQSQGPAPDLPEGSPNDLATLDLRTTDWLGASPEQPAHRAGDAPGR